MMIGSQIPWLLLPPLLPPPPLLLPISESLPLTPSSLLPNDALFIHCPTLRSTWRLSHGFEGV
jgi:hypothetical protein